MQIRFYYIDGISEIDTPYFSTLQAQETYFNNHYVSSMDYAFFPPYYTNIIPVGSDDLNFALNVNYLSFEYLGKTYYYFIENFEYVNENLINLHIVKDNIQTFFFNIKINSGVIERKFIDRYNGNLINRNYIRENFGDGNFIYYSKEIIEDGSNSLLIRKWGSSTEKTYPIISFKTQNSEDNYYSGLDYHIFPCNNKKIKGYNNSSATELVEYETNITKVLKYIIEEPSTLDVYICPFNFLSGSTTTDNIINVPRISSLEGHGNFVAKYSDYLKSGVETGAIIAGGDNYPTDNIDEYEMFIADKKDYYPLPFYKVTSLNAIFTNNNVPALIDNNYMMIEFGSDIVNTTFPLYLTNKDTIYFHYSFNITNGTRYYLINDIKNSLDDKYSTGVIDDNIISMELVTNQWKQYESANRMRWIGAISNTAINAASMLAGGFVSSQIASNNLDIATRDFRNKKVIKHIKPNSKRSIIAKNNYNNAMLENEGSMINSALGNDDILGQAIKDSNVAMQPPSQKTNGNMFANVTKDSDIWYRISKVSNFDYCAWLYHTIGYLVNEPIKNIEEHIFDRVNTRYYYNVLKTKDTIVHLNVLESVEDTEDINRRLEKGLRLWNVENNVTIGTFQYDNVEKSYL